jgi:hypothetical protein
VARSGSAVPVTVRTNRTWVKKAQQPPTEPLVTLTVEVTSTELAALSFVAVAVNLPSQAAMNRGRCCNDDGI